MTEAPQQKLTQKWWFWVLACLMLMFILTIGGCATLLAIGVAFSDTNTNSHVSEQRTPDANVPAEEPATTKAGTAVETTTQHKVGDNVEVGRVRWNVLEAKDLGNVLKGSASNYPSFTDDKQANANSKFVSITVEVENLDTSMKSVTDLSIVDSKGREFTSSSDASDWVPQEKEMFLLSNLNPNVPQQFTSIYEIPNDATDLHVEVDDLSFWGSDETNISLGL